MFQGSALTPSPDAIHPAAILPGAAFPLSVRVSVIISNFLLFLNSVTLVDNQFGVNLVCCST